MTVSRLHRAELGGAAKGAQRGGACERGNGGLLEGMQQQWEGVECGVLWMPSRRSRTSRRR